MTLEKSPLTRGDADYSPWSQQGKSHANSEGKRLISVSLRDCADGQGFLRLKLDNNERVEKVPVAGNHGADRRAVVQTSGL